MEALILTCGTGGGHNTAAQAVEEELTRRGHHAVILDPYTLIGERAARRVGGAYIGLVQRTPRLFGLVYAMGNLYRRLPWRSPVYWINGLLADRMAQYLREHPADVVISTHLFPMEILAHVEPRPRTVYIATDYTCIPFTEETQCDLYIIPSAELTEEFARWGIPRDKLLPYGIPVRAAFRSGQTKAQARQQLDLPETGTCILLAGGSIGAGGIRQAVDVLLDYLRSHEACTLTVLCGSHGRLYDRLLRAYAGNPQVRVLRTTPEMAAWMRASDLFITKPGGLSSTEAAVAGVPILLISPIPSCESRNSAFFESHGMARQVRRLRRQLLPAAEALKDPAAAAEMTARQRAAIDGEAVCKICDELEREA